MNAIYIFTMVAQTVLAMGCEISIEAKDNHYQSKALGNLTQSENQDNGLTLRAWMPNKEEDAEDEDDGIENELE